MVANFAMRTLGEKLVIWPCHQAFKSYSHNAYCGTIWYKYHGLMGTRSGRLKFQADDTRTQSKMFTILESTIPPPPRPGSPSPLPQDGINNYSAVENSWLIFLSNPRIFQKKIFASSYLVLAKTNSFLLVNNNMHLVSSI